jgi:hypothetical protein
MPTRNSVTDSGSLVKTADVDDAAFGGCRFEGRALCRQKSRQAMAGRRAMPGWVVCV